MDGMMQDLNLFIGSVDTISRVISTPAHKMEKMVSDLEDSNAVLRELVEKNDEVKKRGGLHNSFKRTGYSDYDGHHNVSIASYTI